MDLFEGLVGAGIAIYVIDKMTGERKKVYVKDDAEKRRLLAQNKKYKEQLAKKKVTHKKRKA